MDGNLIQAEAANLILDRGVRYRLKEGDITIRPLRFGTVLLIAGMVAASGLTPEKIERGDEDQMRLIAEFGELMLKCVAAAELNDRDKLSDDEISARSDFYKNNLNAFQVYELFTHVLSLSGIKSFKNTIRLLLALKERNLSQKLRGS